MARRLRISARIRAEFETSNLAIAKGLKMASKNMRPSLNLELALIELEEMVDLGIKFVPVQPSPAMLQAGARVGGIDQALAAKIYRAMLEADTLEDPDVPPGLRAN